MKKLFTLLVGGGIFLLFFLGSCDSPTTSPDQVTTYSERLTGADLDAKLSSIKNNKKRYYCSITTLNKPNSEKRFSYQSVIYYLPDEMIDTSNNSTSVLSFVFTSQQAPKNSVYHEKYEHVVRTALCELPVIEGIEEEIKKRLSEFNENTWVGFANRSSNVNVIVSHYESDLEKTEPAFGVMSECGWYCETVWYTVTTQNGEVISIVIECDPQAWVYTCDPPENGTGLDYPPGQEPECEDPTMPCYDGPSGPQVVDPCKWMLEPPIWCTDPENAPCFGDPLPDPEIAPTANQGVQGGRYGAARSNGRTHNGLDIKADEDTPLYSSFGGTVYAAVENNLTLGNYVIIQSNYSGQIIYILYAHLNEISVNNNASIYNLEKIGKTGSTGNAAGENIVPHVHIEIRTAVSGKSWNDWDTHNPENYLSTKFDSSGNPIPPNKCH